jgi:hypothetical protein
VTRAGFAVRALVALWFLWIAVLIYWRVAHPCVRWEQSVCSECDLEMELPGQPGVRTCWHYVDVPCQVCAERRP